jgi:YgiT-type zinc finger domain-containing protein
MVIKASRAGVVAARIQAETQAMRCPICRQGETRPGTATLVLERDELTMVVRHVPAEVCENCGEEYVDGATAAAALEHAEAAAGQGVTVEIREYAVA